MHQNDPGDEDTPQEWGVTPNKPTIPGKPNALACPYCGGTKKIHGPRERDNMMYHDSCGRTWLQFGGNALTYLKDRR